MKKRIVSVCLIISMMVCALAMAGCSKKKEIEQAPVNVEAVATAEVAGEPSATAVVVEATPMNTEKPEEKAEAKNEDMFCGVYLTFSKLKSGKTYKGKFTGNVGENDVMFDFGSQVRGVSAFAAYPPAELSVTDVLFLQTDNSFDGAVSTKEENDKVNISVNASAYIRSGTNIYCNSVFQKANGEVYLTAAKSGKKVGTSEVVVGSATTAFFGGASKERNTTVTLKIENEAYDKLVLNFCEKEHKSIMKQEIVANNLPDCIVLPKACRSVQIEKQKYDAVKGEYETVRTDRYTKKEIGSVLPVYFMGSNPYAASRLIEVIKE